MATRAISPLRADFAVPWLTFAAILTIGAAASWVAAWSIALIDTPATTAARAGIWRLTHGDPFLLASEIRGLALIGWVAVMQPLAVICVMLLIERLAGPRERERKSYLLALIVQSASLLFVFVLYYASGKMGLQPSRPLLQIGPAKGLTGLLIQTLPAYVMLLFLNDFLRYWLHRAQHCFAFLWRFHSVHHSARDLDVLYSIEHPMDQIGNLVLVLLPATFLIGVDMSHLYLLTIFFAVQANLHHMNIPVHFGRLGWLLVDNRYHFIHHSRDSRHFDSNFAALFPVLDRMFNTYQAPLPGPLPATGLGDSYPTRFSHFLFASWPGRETSGVRTESKSKARPILGLFAARSSGSGATATEVPAVLETNRSPTGA